MKENAKRNKKGADSECRFKMLDSRDDTEVIVDIPETPSMQRKLLGAVIQALPTHSPVVDFKIENEMIYQKLTDKV